MRHVRSLRSGRAYAEFVDDAILESKEFPRAAEAAVSGISQGADPQELPPVAVLHTQSRTLHTITLLSISLSSFDHPPQYILANVDGWLRLAAVNRRVRALPAELLAEIFYFCLPFHDKRPHIPDPYDTPLVLCAVCRLWRDVALTTPRLWNQICIDPSEIAFDSEAAGFVDLCCRWISRARSIPLSISFDEYVTGGDPLLELICGLSHQWRDIYLGEDLPQLSLPADRKYPFLEKLSISLPLSDHPTLVFHDAPRLHDVYIPSYTTKIQLPWHQLTKFRTYDIDIADCLELFRLASNLVEVHLETPTRDPSTLLDHDTIFTLPQLESLDLCGAYSPEDFFVSAGAMLISLLRFLKTPALKTLSLGSAYSGNTSLHDISPFLSFASSLQLHTLKLSLVPSTTDAVIACLKATPSVIQLELRISDHIYNANSIFAQFAGYRDFLPELQHLEITFSDSSSTVDASSVISLLIWRCMTVGATPLQSYRFGVCGYGRDLPSDVKAIKAHPVYAELEASGMELYVGFGHSMPRR
ncbi:hypothetical protein C8R45DRAFT_1190136 [Mycena sanguinolenta]|nr:hypothetical protein C8R45DRAFT_1190136 [Mycena sanguinolenta]